MGFRRIWILPVIFAVLLCSTLVSSEEDGETSIKKRSGVHQYSTKTEENNSNDDINSGDVSKHTNDIPKNIKADAMATRLESGRKIIYLDSLNHLNNTVKSNKKIKKNDELFHKIGLTKLKTPTINHHRKRLASQSRKSQRGDSHMYVIKLPPNPYYYAHAKPINPQFDLSIPEKTMKNQQPQTKQIIQSGASLNNVGLNFASNGKPSRIYHWNMPLMKKMMLARKTNGDSKLDTLWDPITIPEQSTLDENDDFVHHKVSYYRPKRPSKKTFHKYFTGNGKPHTLYVIDKSKTSAKYHRLLP